MIDPFLAGSGQYRIALDNIQPWQRALLDAAVALVADPKQGGIRARLLRGDVALTMRNARPIFVDRIGVEVPAVPDEDSPALRTLSRMPHD